MIVQLTPTEAMTVKMIELMLNYSSIKPLKLFCFFFQLWCGISQYDPRIAGNWAIETWNG